MGGFPFYSLGNSCHYITTKNEPAVRFLTSWIVADFDTFEGRALLLETIKYLRESNSMRVCAIHNTDPSNDKKMFSRIVEVAQNTLAPAIARQFLAKVLEKDNAKKLIEGSKKLTDFEMIIMDATIEEIADSLRGRISLKISESVMETVNESVMEIVKPICDRNKYLEKENEEKDLLIIRYQTEIEQNNKDLEIQDKLLEELSSLGQKATKRRRILKAQSSGTESSGGHYCGICKRYFDTLTARQHCSNSSIDEYGYDDGNNAPQNF